MKGGRAQLGYTIVEVMIVLAISGVMFLMAATFINGRSERASFQSGVNDFSTLLQDTIEQVTNGDYPDALVSCSYNGTTNPHAGVASAQGQGGNSKCVFMGKVLHFSESGDAARYESFSLVGGRIDASNNPVTTLVAADPKVVNPEMTVQGRTSQSVGVKSLKFNAAGTSSFAIGFLQMPNVDPASGSLRNGSQDVGMYYVAGVNNNKSTAQLVGVNMKTSLTKASAATFCLTDGQQYATVTLGGAGGGLQPTIHRLGSTPC